MGVFNTDNMACKLILLSLTFIFSCKSTPNDSETMAGVFPNLAELKHPIVFFSPADQRELIIRRKCPEKADFDGIVRVTELDEICPPNDDEKVWQDSNEFKVDLNTVFFLPEMRPHARSSIHGPLLEYDRELVESAVQLRWSYEQEIRDIKRQSNEAAVGSDEYQRGQQRIQDLDAKLTEINDVANHATFYERNVNT